MAWAVRVVVRKIRIAKVRNLITNTLVSVYNEMHGSARQNPTPDPSPVGRGDVTGAQSYISFWTSRNTLGGEVGRHSVGFLDLFNGDFPVVPNSKI